MFARPMDGTLRVTEAQAVPVGARVLDYDELRVPLRHRFPRLARAAPTETPVGDLDCEVPGRAYVRYTEYYGLDCCPE